MAEIQQQNIANYSDLAGSGALPVLTSAPANYQTITGNTVTVADQQRALANINQKNNVENKFKALNQGLPSIKNTTEQLSFTRETAKLRDCMVITLYSPSSNQNPSLVNSQAPLSQLIGTAVPTITKGVEGVSNAASSGVSTLTSYADSIAKEYGSVKQQELYNQLKSGVQDTFNDLKTTGQIEELNRTFYTEGTGSNKSKTIFLPLPKQINDIHSHNIDAFSNNPIIPIAGVVSGLLDSIVGGGGQNTSGGSRKISMPGVGTYIANNLQLAARKSFNPAVETLYRSPTPRNWQWNIEYSPTSKDDADAFIQIVEALKQHSYPTQDFAGVLYTFPGTVDFAFRINGEVSPVLPRSLQKCFIKGVQLDYTQQGFYAHFKDGNPVTIVLTLDIVESRLLDRTDLDPSIKPSFIKQQNQNSADYAAGLANGDISLEEYERLQYGQQ